MKHPFALALAAACFFSLGSGWQQALAQQAEYLPQMQMQDQNQNMTEQNQAPAVEKPKVERALRPYEIQEQAIQKGLSENAPKPQKFDNYTQDTATNWTPGPQYGSVSKVRGVATAAGKMLGRTAAAALPTAGIFLLSRALNRGGMTSVGGNRINQLAGNHYGSNYYQQGYGQQGYNQQGYGQQMAMPNAAMASFGGMNNAGYGNSYYPGH